MGSGQEGRGGCKQEWVVLRIFLFGIIMLPLILFPLFCHFPPKAFSSVHNSMSAEWL